jgi:hypothetical protein
MFAFFLSLRGLVFQDIFSENNDSNFIPKVFLKNYVWLIITTFIGIIDKDG